MRSPYLRFADRIISIHTRPDTEETGDTSCPTCGTETFCDTMRSLWIYDLEINPRSEVG